MYDLYEPAAKEQGWKIMPWIFCFVFLFYEIDA